MLVRINRSLKCNDVWHEPNTIVELPDDVVNDIRSNKSISDVISLVENSIEKSDKEGSKISDEDYDLLLAVDCIDEDNIQEIIALGFTSIEKLATAKVETLCIIHGIGEATAKKIINSANNDFE